MNFNSFLSSPLQGYTSTATFKHSILSLALAEGLLVAETNCRPGPALPQIATRPHWREKLGQKAVQRIICETTCSAPQVLRESGNRVSPPEATRTSQLAHQAAGTPKSGSLQVTTYVPFGWPSDTYVLPASGQAGSVLFCPAQEKSKWEAGAWERVAIAVMEG